MYFLQKYHCQVEKSSPDASVSVFLSTSIMFKITYLHHGSLVDDTVYRLSGIYSIFTPKPKFL